jgi:regulator of sigma D
MANSAQAQLASDTDYQDQTRHLVERWLSQRQSMLSLYCSIINLDPYSNSSLLPDERDSVGEQGHEASDNLEPTMEKELLLGQAHVATNIKIQVFCQVLVDYVSSGHFEVYEKLLASGHFVGEDQALAAKVLPLIEDTTSDVLAFNDKYSTSNSGSVPVVELKSDLSTIGERLEDRFELEDQLIKVLDK